MAAPTIPAGVELATIAWLWTAAIGDETTVPADLTVTFDPAPEWLQYTAATPHMTIAPWSVPATIGPDGTLLGPDGTANVTLLPTDDTDLNPSAWTYQVTVRQGPLILMSFPIAAPGGVTTDLADVTPVAGSTGNAVVVGPPGDSALPAPYTANISGAYTIDPTHPVQVLTVTGVTTISMPAVPAGKTTPITVTIIKGATDYTVTLPTGASTPACKWPQGVAPTVAGPNAQHDLYFVGDEVRIWRGYVSGLGMA